MAFVPVSFPTTVWDGDTDNSWRTSRNDFINPDAKDFDRLTGEVIALQEAMGVDVVGNNPGAKNGAAVSVVESANGIVRRSVFTLTNLSIATVDADVNGAHGSHKLYDFPAGIIQVLGGYTDLTLARVGTSIAAGAALVSSVGTTATATDNATLTTTEADMVPSAATTLSSGAGTAKGKSTAATMAAGVFDGTGTAKTANLNVAVAAADHGAGADAFTVNGTVVLTWINHGDN